MRVFADVLCVCSLSVAGPPVDVKGLGDDEREQQYDDSQVRDFHGKLVMIQLTHLPVGLPDCAWCFNLLLIIKVKLNLRT